jgi:hypothetical protein
VEPNDCPDCGHAWNLHPGAPVTLSVCGECVYEEDDGLREYADMCVLETPADLLVPAGVSFTARVERNWKRRFRVVVQNGSGFRWLTLVPKEQSAEGAQQLLLEVRDDLSTMPAKSFREKYR